MNKSKGKKAKSIKDKNNKYNKILKDEFKRTFPIYAVGIIFHAIQLYFMYVVLIIIGNILDLLIGAVATKEEIMYQVYRLLFYSVIMIIPRIIYRNMIFIVARQSDTNLRKKVLQHLQYVKPQYYDKENKGAFIAYLSKELLIIRKFLGSAFFHAGKMITAPIIGLILIGTNFNPILAITILTVIPIGVYYIMKLNKSLVKTTEDSRQAYVGLSNTIEQNTSGFNLIKLYNEQDNQRKKFENINEEMLKANYKVGMVENKITNIINILYATCYCLGFAFGVFLIQKNMLTIGGLTAYISCISMALSEIVSSTKRLMAGVAYFKQSTKRYNYFFDLEKYDNSGEELKNIDKIEIKNLTYSYNDCQNSKPVLENINMTIKKGEKVGIIGQVGSGKTTLVNILSGFYDVQEGKVFINGKDINKYSKDTIFRNINYAMQKNIITDNTIKNNIDIKKETKEKDLTQISKKADIYQDIKQMQDGFSTVIGENGSKISGGQKQRIQIARNLLNIRDVNIFDDTFSALDVETEKKVLKEIENETKDKILLVISNKISMMEKMDKVYLLIDGKIYDCGTHQELLQKNDLYQELQGYEKAGDLI